MSTKCHCRVSCLGLATNIAQPRTALAWGDDGVVVAHVASRSGAGPQEQQARAQRCGNPIGGAVDTLLRRGDADYVVVFCFVQAICPPPQDRQASGGIRLTGGPHRKRTEHLSLDGERVIRERGG